MKNYIGDVILGTILDEKFSTNDGDGGAVTYTGGTTPNYLVKVFKTDIPTPSTSGVTVTLDYNGLTGLHKINLNTGASSFYEAGYDYEVFLDGATVDSQTVRASLFKFSVEARAPEVLKTYVTSNNATAKIFSVNGLSAVNSIYNNMALTFVSGNRRGEARQIIDWDGTGKVITIDSSLSGAPAVGDRIWILGVIK